ncbi:MAG: hypothetical protein KGH68_03210, partial [Patescibacteria group bacterium]|nr:hypothetical protein [Patescibacteria group bacterium]
MLASIAECRRRLSCASAGPICDTLARFIKDHQRSPDGSWNYLVGVSSYPNDLDDTACALIALERSGAYVLDGASLATFARLLISAETRPGGPYRTWLTRREIRAANRSWRDIDVCVNANIACLLARHGIILRNLDAYIEKSIARSNPSSLYYHSRFAHAYFISRYIASCPTSKQNANTRKKLTDMVMTGLAGKQNPLDAALAICALDDIGTLDTTDTSAIMSAIDQVVETQDKDGSWPACPFYVETEKDGKTVYYGSSELTTALCIEASSRLLGSIAPMAKASPEPLIAIRDSLHKIFSEKHPYFASACARTLERFREKGNEQMIALLPYHFSRSFIDQPG